MKSSKTAAAPRDASSPTPAAAALRALAPPFGGGHFFVGAKREALGIGLVGIASAALAWMQPPFWAALPFVILGDALGAAGRARAARAGAPVGVATRIAPALGLGVVGLLAAAPHVAPDVVAGESVRAACAFAADCEGGESYVACVRRAADDRYAGRGPRGSEAACAACLHGATCELAQQACESCEGIVSLPDPPPEELPPGPIGTAPGDLQMVIPSLVPRPPSHAPDLSDDDLLRLLDDMPPLPPTDGLPPGPDVLPPGTDILPPASDVLAPSAP